MKPSYLVLILLLTACIDKKTSFSPSHIIKHINYFGSDTTKIKEASYLDTVSKKGYAVFYNYFGDTDKIEFTSLDKLDSVQHYTYFCNHFPDTTISVNDINKVEHSSKHRQSLTFTEIFTPIVKKVIYDSINFRKDSLFDTEKHNDKSGVY